ncbi:hypothetical protein Tco_0625392 [Tanacetum coccineum]|uniref:Uncharacterized protein n=1 Tax=Tanacetum coccineum TaxID=301880 RepID=A0ABQ4WGT7_9ASTR
MYRAILGHYKGEKLLRGGKGGRYKALVDKKKSSPTEPVPDDTENVASVPTHFNDPLLSDPPSCRDYEIEKFYTTVSFSEDEGLGDQEDASKQGRKIADIDADAEVTLVDETQGRYDDNLMFDTCILDNKQDIAEKEVDMDEKDVSIVDPVTTAGEVVTTTTTTVDELTLAQTLIEIKAAKTKAVTTAATTTTTTVTKPKARMVEVAQKLQAQLDAKLEEEEKLARQREEDKLVKGSETRTKGSSKRAEKNLNLKTFFDEISTKLDEMLEAEDESCSGKSSRRNKDGALTFNTRTIRANGSSKRYSSMIKMLQNIDREDLETLWKLVKAKYGLTRPEEAYERVL